MKAEPDVTLPIGAGVDDDAPAESTRDGGDVAPAPAMPTAAAASPALPWAMLDEHAGPVWAHVRGAQRVLEVSACTRVGDRRRHANQDAAVVRPLTDGSVIVAVLDGISGSVGVDVAQFRRKLVEDLGLLVESGVSLPLELMQRLHREATRWLGRVAPDAATGAAMVVVRIDIDTGRAEWASAGDVRLLAYCADASGWLRRRLHGQARVLNAVARLGTSSPLAAAVGQRPPLCIEAGAIALAPGEMLLLSSDGGTAPLDETCRVLDAYDDGQRLAGLEGLVNRLDRLAIECSPCVADDRTIVAVTLGRRS